MPGGCHLLFFRVDGTGTASILEGSTDATLTDNDTGDYTLTLSEGGARTMVVVGVTPLAAELSVKIAAVDADSVQLQFDNDGVATDCDFHCVLAVFRGADAN